MDSTHKALPGFGGAWMIRRMFICPSCSWELPLASFAGADFRAGDRSVSHRLSACTVHYGGCARPEKWIQTPNFDGTLGANDRRDGIIVPAGLNRRKTTRSRVSGIVQAHTPVFGQVMIRPTGGQISSRMIQCNIKDA